VAAFPQQDTGMTNLPSNPWADYDANPEGASHQPLTAHTEATVDGQVSGANTEANPSSSSSLPVGPATGIDFAPGQAIDNGFIHINRAAPPVASGSVGTPAGYGTVSPAAGLPAPIASPTDAAASPGAGHWPVPSTGPSTPTADLSPAASDTAVGAASPLDQQRLDQLWQPLESKPVPDSLFRAAPPAPHLDMHDLLRPAEAGSGPAGSVTGPGASSLAAPPGPVDAAGTALRAGLASTTGTSSIGSSTAGVRADDAAWAEAMAVPAYSAAARPPSPWPTGTADGAPTAVAADLLPPTPPPPEPAVAASGVNGARAASGNALHGSATDSEVALTPSAQPAAPSNQPHSTRADQSSGDPGIGGEAMLEQAIHTGEIEAPLELRSSAVRDRQSLRIVAGIGIGMAVVVVVAMIMIFI
jgi:hypothetical protein